jgi:hypothetical protein
MPQTRLGLKPLAPVYDRITKEVETPDLQAARATLNMPLA